MDDADGLVSWSYEYDFFVSFTKDDVSWANWVASKLRSVERVTGGPLRVLIQDDFLPGANWVESIQYGVTHANRMILILSPQYLHYSPFGTAEWQAVWPTDPNGLAQRLVPVRVVACQPIGLLGAIVYIDLVDLTETDAAERLTGKIRRLLGTAPPPGRFPFPGPT